MRRILLVEGNDAWRRDRSRSRGLRLASEVYREALLAEQSDLEVTVLMGADADARLPAGVALHDYDAMVLGGSSLHAYDDLPEVHRQIDLMRTFGETGKPILGSCWGLQIAAVAGGGRVEKSQNGLEMLSARKISPTEDGRRHPLLKGRPWAYDGPSVHYDAVTELPSGAVLLAGNRHSAVQAATIPVGKSEVWGVQYHPEFDMAQLAGLLPIYKTGMLDEGLVANEAEFVALQAHADQLTQDPGNIAARFALGIDDDILVGSRRRTEIRNWLNAAIRSV